MLSGTVKRAKRTGRTVRLTFVVDPAREEPQIEVKDAAPTQPDALVLALETAKIRGAERVAEILKGAGRLGCYELWLMTGKWTGGGRHTNDPLPASMEILQ
ncbi:hypothetical protein GCM10010869_08210 [Mesorhizobium tianshanense]|uniref:Uncharacterized protein n=1 Tax=Mesorhizobium tianshanense TaxID=39844 RepID=A0A562NC05_9HYPH|nr:hypothetical protein [Mesorhizobium tianshanense]TWI29630.1 hypothetical protein IQ26_05052 [Mesorhizobium tianshanense]GLS35233.1 hypothetical protein GCM10010869_08210 [Mesorhizobium tianshanense]